MKLSVIMSVYNENINELEESINSILNQTFNNFNLIIVDDNPNSKALIKYLYCKKKQDNRIDLVIDKNNVGVASAHNNGIKHSNSDYIAIMDADDIAYDNRLECQMKFIKEFHLDFVFSNCKYLYKNGFHSNNIYFDKSIINQNILKLIFNHTNFSAHPTWLLKRSIYNKLNGYRNIIPEDYDFIFRAISYGYKLGYQSKPLLLKRVRNSSVMRNNDLELFLCIRCINRHISKYGYHVITPLNNLRNKLFNNVSNDDIIIFHKFKQIGRSFKYNHNLKNLLLLLKYLFIDKYPRQFVIYKILNFISIYKIKHRIMS